MSTPPGAGQPHGGGPPLEPVRVLRLRRTDALAELMREFREGTGVYDCETLPRAAGGTEDPTQELPPVPAGAPPGDGAGARRPAAPGAGRSGESAPGPRPARGPGDDAGHPPGHRTRRAAVALAVAAAALIGFGGALLLPGRGEQGAARAPRPSATASVTASAAPAPSATAPPAAPAPVPDATAADDPDGPGTLRAGDSGPEVTELQVRLLHVPDVYRDGSTSGRYDAALEAAVARFQLWYGIRGDETGVYGDDTRRALEARTPAGGA
ncbi:peptidoglycan-binding protein [Streptomyces sp. NPDC003697]